MPVPARMHNETLAAMDTSTEQPRRIRRSRRIVFGFVFVVVFVARGLRVSAQTSDVTDADLDAMSGGRTVRVGALSSDGQASLVPLELYVARVLAGEGDPRAADAAQQALAIAIRTYALANLGRHAREGFDICDTTHCQVMRMNATATSRRAAAATIGQVLQWRGEIAQVFYSAMCGPKSESASEVWPGIDYPYLRSRVDHAGDDDEEWTAELSLRDVQAALQRAGFEGRRLKDVRIDGRNTSGRVKRLRLPGLKPDRISGVEFRSAMALRSTAFTVKKQGDRLRVTGRGWGHGVGMCVIAAGRRAARGESAKRILAQYFPGVDIARLEAVAPPPVAPPVVLAAKVAAAAPVVPAAAAAPAPVNAARTSGISVRVPVSSTVSGPDLERLAARVNDELSASLGTSVAPITIQLHETIDSFRSATGRPWWVSFTTSGTAIDLAPAAILEQRDGVEAAVRIALAELLVSTKLADRAAWVRVGAARYFGRDSGFGIRDSTRDSTRGSVLNTAAKLRCPSDAELLLAISATAQREAEGRAHACFARELAKQKDWRAVR